MMREVLALSPFLESLERRLDELPAEQLRRVLLEHGARLPVDEWVGFLHVFDTSGTATGQDGPDLQGDVESFVADITNGVYAEGYGFDSDYGEYRTFGDESWTVEMGDLLDRAGAALLADAGPGAYRMLLEAIGRDDAESGFPGADAPEELIRAISARPRPVTCARSGRASRRPPARPRWWPPTRSATSPVAPAWPRSMPPRVSRCPTSTGCCPT